MDDKSADDLIVNAVTDNAGKFQGTANWKDDKNDKKKFRFEIIKGSQRLTGRNKSKSTGKLIYKDKSPVAEARVRIWEMDSRSADDLIVDQKTGKNGQFKGTGVWKDGGGLIDKATFRYEVTLNGQKPKTGKHILDKKFFNKLQTGWKSPDQIKKKTTVTIDKGTVVYEDHTPASNVRIKIWETDNFRPRDKDDLVVNVLTDELGHYPKTTYTKDEKGIQTFRWEVSVPGTSFVEKGKNIELPKAHLKLIKLKNPLPGWKNWVNDLSTFIDDDFRYQPASLTQLKACINKSISHNRKIKVVGSGHSHSRVAQPAANNSVIDMSKLSGEIRPYPWLKSNANSLLPRLNNQNGKNVVTDMVRVKAGTMLRTLYRKILANKGLGLLNMGPFDGQNIAGLVNTNTHGTGINWPGFTDMVMSVEMLVIVPKANNTNEVQHWVIEPSNGISDPTKFKRSAKGKSLVQDDDVFYSVVCGYGLFGVVYSYTLAVRKNYWLSEEVSSMTWSELKKKLAGLKNSNNNVLFKGAHQTKLYLNTALCVFKGDMSPNDKIRVERLIEKPYVDKADDYAKGLFDIHKIWPPMKKRTIKYGIQKILDLTMNQAKIKEGKVGFSEVAILSKAFFDVNERTEFLNKFRKSAYYRVIRRTRDNNIKVDKKLSYEEQKIDNTKVERNPIPEDFGPSIEIAVPIAQTANASAIIMNEIAKLGIKLVVPVGIRFTAGSKHYMCPTQGRDTAFIELVCALPSKNLNPTVLTGGTDNQTPQRHEWPTYLKIYKSAFSKLCRAVSAKIPDARFHKGKYNEYNVAKLRKQYPQTFDKWLNMYHLFSASEFLDCPNSTDKWKLTRTRPTKSKAEMGRLLEALKTV